MDAEKRVFLDTSVLFAAVWLERGGARLILKLGEAGAASLWVGPWVLPEADEVLKLKSEKSRAPLALLLDQAQVQVGREAGREVTRTLAKQSESGFLLVSHSPVTPTLEPRAGS